MMKIGVISDTHIPGKAKSLPKVVFEAFSKIDHIIHAGDIGNIDVITELQALAPVTAVAGNIDAAELQSMLGEKKIIEIGGFRFGVFHGHGRKGKTVQRATERFQDDNVDCIMFGHSHIPYCEIHDGILLFNPGSPTDKRKSKYYSFGLLDVENVITPHIVYFNADGVVVH